MKKTVLYVISGLLIVFSVAAQQTAEIDANLAASDQETNPKIIELIAHLMKI